MRDQWQRTSSLMVLIANAHRDPKHTRAFRLSDFDPFAQPAASVRVGVEVLKDVFVDGRIPKADRLFAGGDQGAQRSGDLCASRAPLRPQGFRQGG